MLQLVRVHRFLLVFPLHSVLPSSASGSAVDCVSSAVFPTASVGEAPSSSGPGGSIPEPVDRPNSPGVKVNPIVPFSRSSKGCPFSAGPSVRGSGFSGLRSEVAGGGFVFSSPSS